MVGYGLFSTMLVSQQKAAMSARPSKQMVTSFLKTVSPNLEVLEVGMVEFKKKFLQSSRAPKSQPTNVSVE
jgi:hypothetical protein